MTLQWDSFKSGIIWLILLWRGSLSYRNQSIDLLCKSMNWFFYDRDLRHENFKGRWLSSKQYQKLDIRVISIRNLLYTKKSGLFLNFCLRSNLLEKYIFLSGMLIMLFGEYLHLMFLGKILKDKTTSILIARVQVVYGNILVVIIVWCNLFYRCRSNFSLYLNGSKYVAAIVAEYWQALTLWCIILKNYQTYFKNLAVWTPQHF